MTATVARDPHAPDYWTAEAGEHAAGGPGPGAALRRLCRALGVAEGDVLALPGATVDRQRFHLGPTGTCRDCRGTGSYVGFRDVEPCGTCGGEGRVPR